MEEGKHAVEASIELEHAIGFSGIPGCLFYHPGGEYFVAASGGTVVIQVRMDMGEEGHIEEEREGAIRSQVTSLTHVFRNMRLKVTFLLVGALLRSLQISNPLPPHSSQSFLDPHDQYFLSGHDGPITCMAMSKSGRYFASGQNGENSDVLVWDFETKKMLFRLSEHDYGVKCVAFSDDELLLCTVGIDSDKKMIVWDLSNGYIVCSNKMNPQPTNCVSWGGMVKDIKRRDTDKYLLVTSGAKTSVLWELDPYNGELVGEQVHTTGRGEQGEFSRKGNLRAAPFKRYHYVAI
jgi:WD40 repeat protein